LERDSTPKVDAIAKICNAYNISSDWVIMGKATSPHFVPASIARNIFSPLSLATNVAFGIDIITYNVEGVWQMVLRRINGYGWKPADVAAQTKTSVEFIEYLYAGNIRIQQHELVNFIAIALHAGATPADILKIKTEAYNSVMTTRDSAGNTTSRKMFDMELDADIITNTQMIADARLQYNIIEAIIDAVSPDEGELLHIYNTLNENGKKDLAQRARNMMEVKRFSDRGVAADFEKQDTSQKST
jgi:hypothetical protein